MILKKLKVLDIERLGDTDEGVQAGISNESLPFMFEILSTQFYSNPIGSIIREITSNCFDSHQEAGVDEPVIISQGYDPEEGHYIEFQDFGVGLSVDRIYNVYMNYFSSTKRETNDMIGGFGLGSKTPLSYTDFFYITTVYDGLKYEYIYHKGESKPTIESLSGYETVEEEYYQTTIIEDGEEVELEEPILRTRNKKIPVGTSTEDRNGTIIKIIIKDGDLSKFTKELADQLTYFDNVYFKGFSNSNNYEIYEGKNFIFRSDINQSNTNIHICIGKVRYAIDTKHINIGRDIMSIPIGLKFEIGDLQITPNRESIRYTDEAKKLIQDKLELAVEEITDLFNKQNPEIETLKKYNEVIRSTTSLVFNNEKGHKLQLWKYSSLSKSYKFKPLSELGLKRTPLQLFFGWEKAGSVTGENYSPIVFGTSIKNEDIINQGYIILDKNDKLSKYTNAFISETYMTFGNRGTITLFRKRDFNFHDIGIELGIGNTKRENGKARLIYNYNKIIEGIVKENSIGSYKDFRPSNEWLADYKRRMLEQSLAFKRKKNKQVFVRKIRGVNFSESANIKEWDITHRTGILVYGFREDKRKLEDIARLVFENVATIRWKNSYINMEKAFMVIQIARNIESSVIGARKTIYWEDFIKTKYFSRIYSASWLFDKMRESDIGENKYLKCSLVPNYEEDMNKLDKLINKYRNGYVYISELIKGVEIKVHPEMKEMFEYMDKKYSNIKIPFENTISGLPGNKEDRKEYISYLKYKKLRLPNKFYLKDKRQLEYEANLIKMLDIFKGKTKLQLLLTINQNQDGNENSSNNTEETEGSEED